MNTITLTMDATPENLRKLLEILESPIEVRALKEDTPRIEDPTVPEMTAPKADKTTLRELGLKLTKEGKQDVLKDALKDFGATKLSQVKEEHYEALGRRLQESLS